jgi:G3E family GTPase
LPGFVIEELSTPHEGHGPDPTLLAKQIRSIADKGVVDHLVIECDAGTPAIAFASLFRPQGAATQSLAEVATLTRTVLALSPADLLASLVHRKARAALASPCFIAEQIEFAGNIVLEGAQDEPDLALAREIAMALNPRARVTQLSQLTAPDLLEADSSFDFAAAVDGAGWRGLIEGEHTSNRKESDHVTTLSYRAWKPFHPERFWTLLQGGAPGIFRAKGFFWLATRMGVVGGLNLAGAECHVAAAGEWWAVRHEHIRNSEMPERTAKEWREPFGDRRQAIGFMEIDGDPDDLKRQLDACLLTDSEAAAGAEGWRSFSDPFPCWSHHHHDHGHECDHDGESGEHDCCHH